ncbi:MBL fold metallo-hydrolase [Parafrankia sp. EUN1f]|uniref:MBL fold metallo-hydrolase n=1 Tax=Parafrankia sp. EUN1f TaxID=102897 RepID=UPI0001C44226|nr:MBL fold metallo-hydrolase [Parafrankia sp. EUN1f]EFC85782.1 beta-lactamase domain protein [Parafrankia sp. EUN1f]
MAVPRIDPVLDAEARVEPNMILVPPASAAHDWHASSWFEGGWVMPMGGYLLRSADRTILVDAGLGPEAPAGIDPSAQLLDNLGTLGVTTEEVTDVVVTHVHIDHVGWLAPQGQPLFEYARHHVHAADWDWIRSGPASGAGTDGVWDILGKVSDLVEIASGSRTEIADAVAMRLLAGHTPGNCTVDVETSDGPVVLLGDTAYHPVLLVEGGWSSHADLDHAGAARSRETVADEAERSGALLFGAHFPGGAPGRVVRDGAGRRQWCSVTR